MNFYTAVTVLSACAAFALIVYFFRSFKQTRNNNSIDEIKGQIQSINQNLFSYLENKDRSYLKQFDSITSSVSKQVSEMVQQMLGARDVFDRRLEQNAKVLSDLQHNLGEITQIGQRIFDVGRDVSSLQEVLKAPKLRGLLGESFLGELLAEILPAEYFKMQYYFASGEVVDAAVFLRSRILAVDSKFPLENFKKAVSAQDEDTRTSAMKKLYADVKKHIDSVSSKYIKTEENTFDCAFMYIPAENIYYELFVNGDQGGELCRHAYKSKVIPVSPNTFYAYLQIVLFGLKGMQIEQNAKKILEAILSLKSSLVKFTEEFDVLGKHIANTKSKYDESEKKLVDFAGLLENLEAGGLTADEKGKTLQKL